MKKILIGVVLGIVLGAGGSALAVGVITPMPKTVTPLGAKKVEVLTATEIRFQAIEQRLSNLEHKKK